MWQDYLLLGELVGLPREAAPATYHEFREYFNNRFKNHELFLTESAEYMGKEVCFNVPVPRLALPARKLVEIILLGSLPKEIREMYHLPWGKSDQQAYQSTAALLRRGSKFLPTEATQGKNTLFFDIVA